MTVNRIFSAGGIILRHKTKGLSQHPETGSDPAWEVLVTQHSKHRGWDFPKGHIELGESSEDAALREVEEETGIKAEIIEKVGSTQYFYYDADESTFAPFSAGVSDDKKATVGKKKVLKTVTFYLMKYVEEGEATTAYEVSDHKWLPVDKVEEQLTFKDTKGLWGKTKERIEQLTGDN